MRSFLDRGARIPSTECARKTKERFHEARDGYDGMSHDDCMSHRGLVSFRAVPHLQGSSLHDSMLVVSSTYQPNLSRSH